MNTIHILVTVFLLQKYLYFYFSIEFEYFYQIIPLVPTSLFFSHSCKKKQLK